ncbi:TPA: flavodoxin domain-containing protein [Pseudomonas aeruginosa]|uniref:flavodoxin domain-containing protein n=1 Tax=Pseudomonas aeruginosa TaxID=287 RepID=UPI000B48C087|nr:flavodoxin domain-containing protein [Pseudomonas aeruginosa]MBG4351730.1 flavodoxin domain-containing protein [Pseudomonas aeruginosa]MCU9105303.1 flavodoxin domain-containing protein [Pseudomonas aeruginosa]MCU9249779.1 flavodoxin domain-containing protein [Pseudomonas aeruginosa]MCU9304556.1 flavodoxin domain-containing protein [Pseudomonas aeruginosa]MCU9510335.1 flavodoxin domain-containing protein [Pseudomonas aeruginosa]
MNFHVLYGTETGNAEMVADDIVDVLQNDVSIESTDMSKFSLTDLSPEVFYFVVCSTYGDGELPHSAQPFFTALNETKPDLTGLRFAVFGLGDKFYETYNKGSELIAKTLTDLGAIQIGERGLHDATSGQLPGDIATSWAKEILSQI